MYDLTISNALLYDGSGRPARRGTIAVADGTIAVVCPAGESPGPAREAIDGDGLAVMPGIIDNHTHYDAQITWDRTLESSAAQGVTTVLLGNCGFAIAPCRPEHREYTMRTLTQVEGMALEALRAGIRWDFETFPQYLDMLERNGCALNVAVYVGHSSVRTYVMGEESARRAARPDEIERMAALVTQALEVGAVGFATSTSPAHNGEGGMPVPSRLADESELRALLACLGKSGRGTFMLTKGGQTRLDFLEELGSLSGRPVVVAALLHNRTNPHGVFGELDYLQSASARGRTMLGAVSCCPLTMEFTLASPYPLEGLHGWKPALGLEGRAYRALLGDPAFRQTLRRELAESAAFRLFNGEWQEVRVLEAKLERNAPLEQLSIAEIARQLNKDPLDAFLDLALDEDLATLFAGTLLNSDEDAVGRMLRHPASLVSLSDAGAHLTFFNDAGFGLHLIGHWARDCGAMSVEEAVAKLTAQPARLFGLPGRGLLHPGYAADLLLFDLARVGRGLRRKTHDLPAGAARLHTQALGIHGVWVNGRRIADAQGLCEPVRSAQSLPGTLIRRFDQPS